MSEPIGPSPFVVSDRNLALELVRVTEAAALASSRWTGRGRKNDADGAAVEAMRTAFDTVAIDGTVVIGEGEMDEAPMLYIGEKVGSGGPAMDIAVDPLEGTNLCAKDMPNAITVVALAERGNFLHAPDIYMDKIVVGPGLPEGVVDLDASIENNLKNLARAKGRTVHDLLLCTLERERHEEMIARARAAGARVRLLTDGDVAGGIAACLDNSQVDIYVGSGGAPEGVLTAAAVRCVEGQMQGRLLFETDEQRERALAMNPGKSPDRKLGLHEMAAGPVLFSATGVTTGALLRGVRHEAHQAVTHSLVMRSKSGTSRYIEGHHNFRTKTWAPQ
ncbi:class II fructose-bisphosphatase [Acetobacter sp. TBRC 12305]|uniref:Fructose-1,6-bisphosphatase n=1 Tax=Acetobacter garciniae TaxID=2817435 RepID=A0A939KN94_9PROT|nr:class II fructose-bisphosphatase [Acetobacter garciniae]MBO1325435.1 class II fructose-bisphosphatase [Acetobacter garciniae]MBX0345393.1 class II fructose-bisphosphatase [Acetobacter garciniae]